MRHDTPISSEKRSQAAEAAEPQEKLAELRGLLAEMGSALVAFSGGVDSTLLAFVARELGLRHRAIETSELDIPEFACNPRDRCCHCKRELFSKLKAIAAEEGLSHVADGTNADDLADYRPGRRALKELGVRSPLLEAEMGKSDIRALSQALGLPTWDKPAYACLASRFPYGDEITRDKLEQIDEAERFLRGLGLGLVRVRHHGDTARIEVAEKDIPRVLAERGGVVEALKGAGFSYVALDLEGYRTGSMNEVLRQPRAGGDGRNG